MKIKTIKLHNFRSYKDVTINFDNLTAFVGKTILENRLYSRLWTFFQRVERSGKVR